LGASGNRVRHLGSSAGMSGEPIERAGQDPAHDVLAAEAFAVPAPDPELRQRAVVLPEDPSGIAEPHDILAAEEFAMPAAGPAATRGSASRPKRGLAAAALLGGLVALLRRRRR
jgi:hypothetical protein